MDINPIMPIHVIQPFQYRGYFHPKHKDANIFEKNI